MHVLPAIIDKSGDHSGPLWKKSTVVMTTVEEKDSGDDHRSLLESSRLSFSSRVKRTVVMIA